MCHPNRILDRKGRIIYGIGNFSLIAGLLLWRLVHPTAQIEKNWLDGVCGFLLGFYITVNLCVLRLGRRGRGPLEPKGTVPTETAPVPQP
jgi:uncharacterized membrane protein YedE/YeeE